MNQLTPLQKDINSIVVAAREMKITKPEDLQTASNFLVACNSRIGKINELFDKHIQKANGVWKGLIADKNTHLNPVEDAKRMVNAVCSTYNNEQARIAAKVKADAVAEARKQADEQKETEADQVESEGFKAEADIIRKEERPVIVPAASIPEPAKPKGMVTRNNWKIKVVNLGELIKGAPAYVMANQKALNVVVKALKEGCKIPGCTVWNEPSTHQRKV